MFGWDRVYAGSFTLLAIIFIYNVFGVYSTNIIRFRCNIYISEAIFLNLLRNHNK